MEILLVAILIFGILAGVLLWVFNDNDKADCELSQWSYWEDCGYTECPVGKNSVRTRTVIKEPKGDGKECGSLEEYTCDPSIDTDEPWGRWSTCVPADDCPVEQNLIRTRGPVCNKQHQYAYVPPEFPEWTRSNFCGETNETYCIMPSEQACPSAAQNIPRTDQQIEPRPCKDALILLAEGEYPANGPDANNDANYCTFRYDGDERLSSLEHPFYPAQDVYHKDKLALCYTTVPPS